MSPERMVIDPGERRVMGVLGRRGLEIGRSMDGGYKGEEADAMEWLMREAHDVFAAICEGRDPVAGILDGEGSNFWPDDLGPFPEALRAELIAAAGGAS